MLINVRVLQRSKRLAHTLLMNVNIRCFEKHAFNDICNRSIIALILISLSSLLVGWCLSKRKNYLGWPKRAFFQLVCAKHPVLPALVMFQMLQIYRPATTSLVRFAYSTPAVVLTKDDIQIAPKI